MNSNKNIRKERAPMAPAELPETCAQVQPLLFDYLSRELGDKQSEFIQNHLRHCPVCSREAAELQATVELLRADQSVIPPEKVSKGVRARLERALLHPFLEWVYVHRRFVSWVAALLLIGLILLLAIIRSRYPETVTYWITR